MKRGILFGLIAFLFLIPEILFAELTLEESSNWWMVYSDHTTQGKTLFYSRFLNGNWSEPKNVLEKSGLLDHSPAVAVGGTHGPIVSFIREEEEGGALYVARWGNHRFQNVERLDQGSGLVYRSPSISLDHKGRAWITAVGYEGKLDQIVVFQEGLNGAWEKTQVSVTDLYPDIDPAILFVEGKVFVLWSGYDGSSYRIFYSTWNGNNWSEEVRLMTVAEKGGDEFPSLFLQDGNIHAAWQRLDKVVASFWKEGSWSSSFIEKIRLMDTSYMRFLQGVHGAQACFGWFDHPQSKGSIRALILNDIVRGKQVKRQDKNFSTLIARFFTIKLREAYAASIENKYTAFGDSLTEGAGGGGVTYPRQLDIRLDNNIAPSEVVNRGLGGEKTTAGLERINDVLGQDNPEFILIMEGTNDVTAGRHRSTVGFNLEEMVVRSKNFGTNPILATIPSRNPGDSLQKGMPQYAETIRDVAINQNIPLCDVFAILLARPDLESLFSDTRIHFNSTGYDVIAEAWFQTIASVKGVSSSGSSGGGGGGCGTIKPTQSGHFHFNLELPLILLLFLVSWKLIRRLNVDHS